MAHDADRNGPGTQNPLTEQWFIWPVDNSRGSMELKNPNALLCAPISWRDMFIGLCDGTGITVGKLANFIRGDYVRRLNEAPNLVVLQKSHD